MQLFKKIGLLMLVGLVGMSAGIAIMWGVQGFHTSAAGETGHGCELVRHAGTEASCQAEGVRTYWECPEHHLYFSDAEGINQVSANELSSWRVIQKLEHKTEYHARKEATCAKEGNVEYYHCVLCGKNFSDADCQNEITDSVVIDKLPFDAKVCTEIAARQATCQQDGNYKYYFYSDNEGEQIFNEYGVACNYSDVVIEGGHQLVEHAAVEVTCTEDGKIKYYECERCHKIYKDKYGMTEISIDDTVVTKKGHTLTYVAKVEPTCTEDGYPEYWVCSECGKKFADANGQQELTQAMINTCHKLGHDYKLTCTPNNRVNPDVVPSRHLVNNEIVADSVEYYLTCSRSNCHEHDVTQAVRWYAVLADNQPNVTNATKTQGIGVNDVVEYDVFTINASDLNNGEATIVINVAQNYSSVSRYMFDYNVNELYDEVVNGQMNLNIHFDTLPTEDAELVWKFDWDADGKFEQKIKVILKA